MKERKEWKQDWCSILTKLGLDDDELIEER
jgi:hypothetical protein